MAADGQQSFDLIVVGDEILTGKRQDKHLQQVIKVLSDRYLQLYRASYVGDQLETLTRQLVQSLEHDHPVLCFGGIGATPDDNTREAAARALSRPIERHPEAAKLIEQQFGDEAYPRRILMADLPQGSALIPNPVNNIPGFSVDRHFFFPGFPSMAWPMLDWVLERYFADTVAEASCEKSVRVFGQRESDLIPMMEQLIDDNGDAKLFSLPHMGEQPYIEIGFRGPVDSVQLSYHALCQYLDQAHIRYQPASAGC